MIAELTEHHSTEKRTRAFSLLQVTFGLGSTVGAVLGGKVQFFKWHRRSLQKKKS
jgi:predicted MFS family arabinose efflux permease